MGKLTAELVKRYRATGRNRRYSDGDGLSLVIRANGSKAWQVRLPGTKADKGIGAYPEIKLSAARREARDMRDNEIAARRSTPAPVKAPTFAEVAERFIEANAPLWRHHKTAHDTRSRLTAYAYPAFGSRPISTIKRSDVMDVLEPIWTSKPSAARKLKQRIRAVFTYALARDMVVVNPVDEAVAAALPKTPATKAHFRSLPYDEVADALAAMSSSESRPSTKSCLRWLVLNAARSGEARGATWAEIDMEAKTWTIPGSRMKSGRDHRVPLSLQAIDLLTEAMPLMNGTGLLFPGLKGQLSDMTLTKMLRDNDYSDRATVHGFRTSFKTWCMETTDTPWAVGEAALAHTLGNSTEQAYARSDLFEKRRTLMQQWADYLS